AGPLGRRLHGPALARAREWRVWLRVQPEGERKTWVQPSRGAARLLGGRGSASQPGATRPASTRFGGENRARTGHSTARRRAPAGGKRRRGLVKRAGEPVSWRLPGETEAGSAGTQPGRGITGPTVRRWTAPGPGRTPGPFGYSS